MAFPDGEIALITYRKESDTLHLLHAEVPMKYRGRGIGKELVHKTLDRIEQENNIAVPHCSYIKAVVSRSNKWQNII